MDMDVYRHMTRPSLVYHGPIRNSELSLPAVRLIKRSRFGKKAAWLAREVARETRVRNGMKGPF